MNDVEREVLKIASEAYDLALEGGARFNLTDLGGHLAESLVDRLSHEDHSVTLDLIHSAAYSAIRRVDRERTKPAPATSLLDDLDRSIPVDEGQRIARRRMTNLDWSQHLAHIASNVSRVTASAAKENARYAALATYLADGLDTAAAITAWQADHAGETLP